MSGYKISITIPAYKSAYLADAIESCLKQTYNNFEIIIVDDASPEDLYSIVSQYNDIRIHYYRNEKNYGVLNVVDNWNTCLKYCSGDYVICMGDDDRLLPCCLQEYIKLIDKYPGLGLYHAWTEMIDEDGNFLRIQERRPEWESVYSLLWHRIEKSRKVYIGDWLFEINLLKENGGFYKIPMAWGSDEVSAYRAAIPAGVANTQVLCFQYRENRLTLSKSKNGDYKMHGLIKKKEWIIDFLRKEPTDVLDKKYYKLLPSAVDKFFKRKFAETMKEDMLFSPIRLFHWIKYRKEYNVSLSLIFYSFMESIRKQMFK